VQFVTVRNDRLPCGGSGPRGGRRPATRSPCRIGSDGRRSHLREVERVAGVHDGIDARRDRVVDRVMPGSVDVRLAQVDLAFEVQWPGELPDAEMGNSKPDAPPPVRLRWPVRGRLIAAASVRGLQRHRTVPRVPGQGVLAHPPAHRPGVREQAEMSAAMPRGGLCLAVAALIARRAVGENPTALL